MSNKNPPPRHHPQISEVRKGRLKLLEHCPSDLIVPVNWEKGCGERPVPVWLKGKSVLSWRGREHGAEMITRGEGARTDKLCLTGCGGLRGKNKQPRKAHVLSLVNWEVETSLLKRVEAKINCCAGWRGVGWRGGGKPQGIVFLALEI